MAVRNGIPAFVRLWVGRLRHVPPRDFWPTLIHFLCYALTQARHAARRNRVGADRAVNSHLNFKRAHYLEKAMLCDYGRSTELDKICADLRRYLDTPEGRSDDCSFYLMKLVKEYETYPEGFRCFMHGVAGKPPRAEDERILRRIIVQRRSRRLFADTPVATEMLERIVEAGSYAPSSCNAQPLAFITLTERGSIDAAFGAAQGADDWKGLVPAGLVIATDRRHYKPFEQHPVMFQDIAAAAQNCLLMAEAMGLAACWVSLVSDIHIDGQKNLYEILGLPNFMLIGAAIALGHPANAVCMVPRRPLHRIWHRETFGGHAGPVGNTGDMSSR